MAVSKCALRLKWPVKNAATDVEHCRLLVLARETVVEDLWVQLGLSSNA
jgi:hypothetical protein